MPSHNTKESIPFYFPLSGRSTKTNGTDSGGSHTSHSFEQVGVGEANHMARGCFKTRKNLPDFRGKLNKIWLYLKLIENWNWRVVPSWLSIIEPKTTRQIYFSDIHRRKPRKKILEKSPKESLHEKHDFYPLFKMAATPNRENFWMAVTLKPLHLGMWDLHLDICFKGHETHLIY